MASIVLGAVGINWVRGEHKPQQGDASPVWSGLCVRPGNLLFLITHHQPTVEGQTKSPRFVRKAGSELGSKVKVVNCGFTRNSEASNRFVLMLEAVYLILITNPMHSSLALLNR